MHEHTIPTRWLDFDLIGHVTHTALINFFDEARDAYLRNRTGSFEDWPTVLVRGEFDYTHEIPWPTSRVTVQTEVAEVGRTSVAFQQQLLANDIVCAKARTVVVHWDAEKRRSREIGESHRQQLLEKRH